MKACLNTIQQTLTQEAANVLKQSIAEAGRRNHGQTTPLHVAATLLVSPTGFLRQACIRSHPNSSHPLQCRALELCFSVALERLPTTAGADNSAEPPLSNALMAALKRAQAHQRRGCPEQQQQPLLAVKVELVQFIISILDDPSVSRVMREASFSSPAVKAAIEQSLMTSSSSSPSPSSPAVSRIGLGFRPMPPTATPPPLSGRTVYLNPRLQTQQQQQNINPNLAVQSSGDDVRKVIEILSRTRKKNPILVGESEPETVLREVLRRIEKRELGESGPLSNVEVVSVDKELGFVQSAAPLRLSELGSLVEMRMKMLVSAGGGLILDLGDLRWLVDQPPGFGLLHQGGSDVAREAVADMGKLIARFRGEDGGGAGGGRLWVIGTATCETYLRCQVYHPSMENEWDLQAVPIAARAPLHSKFPRLVTNSMESYSHLKNLPTTMHPMIRTERSVPQNLDPSRKISCCPQCLDNYEKEVSKLSAGQPEKPVSEVPEATRPQLPQWLQNAKNHTNEEKGTLSLSQNKDQHEPALKQKSEELMKKWSDKCLLLHPSFHHNSTHERINPKPLTLTSMYANPNLFGRQPFQPFQPKSHQPKTLGDDLRLNMNSLTNLPTDRLQSLPLSPVRTDLILGQTKTPESPTTKNTHVDEVKDLLSCMSSESPVKVSELQSDKPLDADSFKKLLKGLIDKVWWQRDAASAVTATVTRCKLGNGRKRAGGAKGDIWMLFSGPDRTGKKKMVTALSEQVCGAGPVIICLGSTRDKEESDMNFRGKTVLDRIAEAVRRYPFSVIMLQDIDEADMLVRGNIKRAMERGRFTDSYGREISLGSIIFILTANNRPPLLRGNLLDEEKLGSLVSSDWQLRISVGKPNKGGAKRHLSWMAEDDGERASKQRREAEPSLSFDLNEMADVEEDRIDGSDLTVEYEEDKGHSPTTTSASHEFIELVDESIVFKPVEFGLLRKSIERTITTQFRDVLGENLSISIESEALDKILGGAWLGNSGLDSWVEEALVPAIQQLKTTLPAEECVVARLELDEKPEARKEGDWLPSRVAVSVVGG